MPKIVLITGASRGIGAQTALLAATKGWRVVVNYAHDHEAAQHTVDAIHAGHGQAMAIQADVSEPMQIQALFERIDQTMGPIDALVNNAGIVDLAQRVDQYSPERLQRMMQTNVIGPFLCAQQAILRMSPRHQGRGGSIVNVSSIAARLGGASQYVDYAASKAAIDAMTIGLSKELASEGIRVNAVSPGIIDTDIHASAGQPQRVRQIGPTLPMGRAGSALEVAQAIVWLLGEEASYCSGSILEVGGAR